MASYRPSPLTRDSTFDEDPCSRLSNRPFSGVNMLFSMNSVTYQILDGLGGRHITSFLVWTSTSSAVLGGSFRSMVLSRGSPSVEIDA